MVSVEYGSCLVTRYDHSNSLGNPGANHIAHGGSAQIVKNLSLEASSIAGFCPLLPRNLPKPLSMVMTYPDTHWIAP